MARTFNRAALVCAAVLLLAAGGRASAQLRVGGTAGITSGYGHTYFSLGGHVGYVLPLGLEPNLELQWWTGQSPNVVKLSPGLTWYLPVPVIRPYVGGFYSHWFVSGGNADQDSLGARAGILLVSTGPLGIGVGVAYEHLLSCSVNCDSWTPEAAAYVTF